MKQFLFIIITILTFNGQCLAAEDEINPENGAAPILLNVCGGMVYHDDTPIGPHRNQVHTENPEEALSILGLLKQPGKNLLNISCGILDGKGRIEGDYLSIDAKTWGFHGIISCENTCVIKTTSDIDTLRLNTAFIGGGMVIARRLSQEGVLIGEQEFVAHPLILN